MLLVLGFGWRFIRLMNYEFVIYVAVIVGSIVAVALSNPRIRYRIDTLIGLTIWAALHLAGGGVFVNGTRLYDRMLITLSETLPIVRYDQLVHCFGFGAATLLMYDLVAANGPDRRLQLTPSMMIVIVMAGLGLGAFNEIVEFGVTALLPESGVGGYVNTSLDLCANLFGALLALVYLRARPELAG